MNLIHWKNTYFF